MSSAPTGSAVIVADDPVGPEPAAWELQRSLSGLREMLRDAVGSLAADYQADAFSALRLSCADARALLDRVSPAGAVRTHLIPHHWFPGDAAMALGLDDFDIATLLITLAPEIDPVYERIYGFLNDDLTLRRPTVGLVTRLLGGDSEGRRELSRFLPGSRLMASGLLQLAPEAQPGGPLASRQLCVGTQVLSIAFPGADDDDLLESGRESGRVLSRDARGAVWREQLRTRANALPGDDLIDAAAVFLPLTAAQIAAAVKVCVSAGRGCGGDLLHRLQHAALDQYRSPSALGRHVPLRRAFAGDLILPERTRLQLDGLRRRMAVHETVRERSPLAGGLTALFTGPSGTGKTLAAECLAHALGCELFRISASRLYDKYVGETEKNIDRMFEVASDLESSAPASTTILLVDEAEWLFSRRVEGRDAHDHYLNVRVGHLLQRLEAYRGMAILTSNLPANLDSAFRRRWFQHVTFEPPDEEVRQRLWLHALDRCGIECRDIDTTGLAAAFPLSGGSIRNVVLMAVYDACAEDQPLQTRHLHDPLAREFQKLGHDIDAAGAMAANPGSDLRSRS